MSPAFRDIEDNVSLYPLGADPVVFSYNASSTYMSYDAAFGTASHVTVVSATVITGAARFVKCAFAERSESAEPDALALTPSW